jgi:hypothetical protein
VFQCECSKRVKLSRATDKCEECSSWSPFGDAHVCIIITRHSKSCTASVRAWIATSHLPNSSSCGGRLIAGRRYEQYNVGGAQPYGGPIFLRLQVYITYTYTDLIEQRSATPNLTFINLSRSNLIPTQSTSKRKNREICLHHQHQQSQRTVCPAQQPQIPSSHELWNIFASRHMSKPL